MSLHFVRRKEQVAAAEAQTEAVKRWAEKAVEDLKEAAERLKEVRVYDSLAQSVLR